MRANESLSFHANLLGFWAPRVGAKPYIAQNPLCSSKREMVWLRQLTAAVVTRLLQNRDVGVGILLRKVHAALQFLEAGF